MGVDGGGVRMELADRALLHGASVLLVDDDPASVALELRTLRRFGCEVRVAATTREAAALVAEGLRPALVLLDLELTDQAGGDLLRVLRSTTETAASPVVAVTASGISFGEVAARAAGCDALVRKPTDPGAFPRLLASFLRADWTRTSPAATTPGPVPPMLGRWEAILSAVAVPICVVRPSDLQMLYANPRFERVTGYTRDQVVGFPIAVASADDINGTQWMREIVRRQLAEHGEGTFEVPRRKADGSTFWLRITAAPMRDDELGELWVLTFEDVTERRRADDALRVALARSEGRFAKLFDMGVLAIATSDLTGRMLDANDAFLDLLGYSRAELEHGRLSTAEFTLPEYRNLRERVHEASTANGVMVPTEKEYRRKDGTLVPVLVGGAMLDDATIVGFAVDLSEKRRGEAALRESHARFNALSRSGMVGILVADASGCIHDANDAFLAIVGYQRGDLQRGISWISLTPAEYQADGARAAVQLEATGFAGPWEKEYQRKDGTRVPVLVAVARLNDTQNITIVADLSEQRRSTERLRRTEDQLRQAQKMEAVGRLAGGVAHDFNNLLSVILSYSDLMLGDMAAADPLRSDLGEIRLAADRASGLTRQLLQFSRQHVVDRTVVDVDELVIGMAPMLRRLLGEDIELVVTAGAEHGRVRADRSELEQIVMNLAVNARDAMPTGGKLTIETRTVELEVVLSVTDTGGGMTAETQRKIFDPFFTTKPVGKGTGLGLSTVFGIVQDSGGHVEVDSEPGQGATFEVYLPRVEAAVRRAKATDAPPSRLGTETILLVEDEEQVRKVALGILRRQGYEVLEAKSAEDALALCGHHPGTIHLLLTDVVMPQMSGPELARRLAVLRPALRVLCMSGYTDDSVFRQGVIADGTPYLQKPLTPDSLTRKVRDVLDRTTETP